MTALKVKEIYELNAQREWNGYSFSRLLDVLYEYWCDHRFWTTLRQVIPFQTSRNVLDVGCGVVSVLNVVKREYPQLEMLGVDPLIERYLQLYDIDRRIRWLPSYMESLDLPSASHEIVCCSNALDHVEDVQAALHELRRVVTPQGTLLLTMDVFAAPVDRNEGHPFSFTVSSIATALRNSGFQIAWQRLDRRKLGMMNYANCRLRQGMTRKAVFLRRSIRQEVRSYAKQLIGRGALGELVLVAKAI